MAGKFAFKKFSELDLSDSFFDSLKADYPGTENSTGFEAWFAKKAAEGRQALVFSDDEGIGAFIFLKTEDDEPIALQGFTLPACPRIKIGTLRLAERYRGKRLGEGAIGLALWYWQKSNRQEIYVTVYPKQATLIGQLERFGFVQAGLNLDGECVYIRSNRNVDYSDPYKSFPFINPNFQKAGYLIIEDYYHDTMFPYSVLDKTLQTQVALNVANGICKIYVGSQYTKPHYQIGEPVFIYRKFNGTGTKRYKSCVTSYCIVTDVIMVKTNNQPHMTFDELINRIGNKSVFDRIDLQAKYNNERNLCVVEMLYYGYFGAGKNVNMDWLDNHGCWSIDGGYPANIQLSPDQFRQILKEGNINVPNVIIN
jgi:hypothetical protein